MDAEESKNSRRLLEQPNNRRKIVSDVTAEGREQRWRTEVEQQIYSSRLAEALRRVSRRRSSSYARSPINGRLVRETADCVLAATAKGRTRWSRAILASRFRQRLARRRRTKKLLGCKPSRVAEAKNEKIRKLPAVQRKVKILGRLVPGCRKLSFPNLLEEATDYISALEMQVKAMAALAELLAGTQSNLLGISNDS
ncbi:transcription factor bHLH149 [Benincasa hispida]|uniref:transcription factor bHLH149 n=1 Tax=Benincasa hispida TaxID=102211 RepID=UPI00190219C7|nr:transcription factor bHLH149 [Benincasa hispida]